MANFGLILDNFRDSSAARARRGKKYRSLPFARTIVSFISLALAVAALLPSTVRANVFDTFFTSLLGAEAKTSGGVSDINLQTMTLPRPAMNINPTAARGGGDITIVDSSALMPGDGPSGTIADIEKPKNAMISVYVVREGDTLTGIAKMFDVSPSTILWANDLPRASKLLIGQTLTILPVTGIKYTVKKGDTIASIAKKYSGDTDEIVSFNGLEGESLVVGTEIIIPDGEIPVIASAPKTSTSPSRVSAPAGTPQQIGYYLRPIVGGKRSQGVHGYNAVDIASPVGTPIMASAEGDVIVARAGGWNGGYGSYVVIQHGNGSQTLYGHMSKVSVYSGQHVVQGQVIGTVGATGKVTGAHVHFEIRNGIRNPF